VTIQHIQAVMQAIRVPVMDLDFGQELQLVDCWDTCLETQGN